MFKICLIGCGIMAYGAHGDAVSRYQESHPDTELSACCDIDESKAEDFSKKYGFERYYTDYEEMLDKEKPDVVMVICPVALTYKISSEVMKRGINIILEKPPGVDSEETAELHRLALENNVHARVAFNRRYMPLITELREEIKKCGKPVHHADCNFVRVGRTEPDFATTAIHGIDTIKYLVGADYSKVDVFYHDYIYESKNITNYYLNCEFESGAYANINFMRCSGCMSERIHISCEDYTFFLETPVGCGIDMSGKLICTYRGDNYKIVTSGVNDRTVCTGFYHESAEFFDIIRGGKAPESDIDTGIQSVEIADCLRKRIPSYMQINNNGENQ